MKLSELDIIVGRNIVLQSICFHFATELIAQLLNESDPEGDPINSQNIAREIGMKASEIVEAMSDDKIRQELEQLDRALHLAISIKRRGLVALSENLPVQFISEAD